MKICVVYNTCEISGRENSHQYIYALESILQQNYKNYNVVISGCCNSENTKQAIKNHFGGLINYNWIDEKLPVNITFNDTVRKYVKLFGEADGYLYVDSGIDLYNSNHVISTLSNLSEKHNACMVSALADNDNATVESFGWEKPVNDFVVPVGKAINLHVQLFTHQIFKEFGNIIPDIFASFCTESVFSFIAASIKSKWVISKDLELTHIKSLDGASSGFQPTVFPYWWHLFKSKRTMQEICSDQQAYKCGFGYEESNNVLLHNPEAFDENGYAKSDELKQFIKDNIYLNSNTFNYDEINSIWQ